MADSTSSSPPEDSGGFLDKQVEKILVDTYVCFAAFVLLGTFVIIVTRFRLWHTNWILKQIPQLVDNPLTALINFCLATLPAVSYQNDLYLIWMVVLTIAYDNVLTISAGSTPGSAWVLREYVDLFYAVYIGIYVNNNKSKKKNKYYSSLLFLWLLVLVKFSLRLVFNKLVKRAYGPHNSKLVADYMKCEHELVSSNEVTDPTNMKGYKYLVVGEGQIDVRIVGPDYKPQIELPQSVVTVEKVWSCNNQLLGPSMDADNSLKDICLSFAFFKLLKRRFYEYPAAEAQLGKTRRLVFGGLLKREDKHSVFRIIGMEIGFLRDLFYTRYPSTFAYGFPVFHVALLLCMVGVSIRISRKAFLEKNDPNSDYLWSSQHHNVDYRITNILLIMMILMEAFETMSYIFSDWAKVMLICQQVRSWMPHHHFFLYNKVLALHCKWQFTRSLNNTIGQFALLKNYRKGFPGWLRVNCFPYSTWGWAPLKVAPRGMREDKAVQLSMDVKQAILGALQLTDYGRPTKGIASLQKNKVYNDLARTCALQSDFHTLVVWHIATSLCAIHPAKEGGDKKSIEHIEPHHTVAKHLSNYCAYLMVFQPEMLPDSIFSVKLFFREILSETKSFFQKAKRPADQYNLMMQVEGFGSNNVIDIAVWLGKYLMQIPDDVRRWQIMADFWSEFILFLAPSGKVREHLKMLESGGEFITHLWALLYHVGIVEHTDAANSGHYP